MHFQRILAKVPGNSVEILKKLYGAQIKLEWLKQF